MDPIEQLKDALAALFVEGGGWIELRALGKYRKYIKSGYYNNFDRLASDARQLDMSGEYKGIYVVLNKIKDDLHHRAPNMLNRESGPATTSDSDITARAWLPLDFDPKRPAGISSSEEEHKAAIDRAIKVRGYLTEHGFPLPILADSGNGAHLLYKIDLPNDSETTALIKDFLKSLAYNFTDDKVDVDLTMFNAARISKLPGTVTRKGEQSEDRVWRRACIIENPAQMTAIPRELLEFEVWAWKATQEPNDESGTKTSSSAIGDLGEWLKGKGLSWSKTKIPDSGGITYILDECPWCHNRDDSCHVTSFTNGGFNAGCHHHGCAGKHWAEFMKVFNPAFVSFAERQLPDRQSRQERDKNHRCQDAGALPDLTIYHLCTAEIVNEGKSNEYEKFKFSPELAADSIIQRFDVVTTEDDKIWVYRDGFYSLEWWTTITDLVNNIAGDHFPTRMKKELEAKVHSKTRVKEEIFYKNPYLLCCQNCTVDLENGEILEHSPEHYLNSPSAFVYNPGAWPAAFLQLIDESCYNDIDRMTLIDWLVATCCLVSFEFILFMTGGGSNGKRMYEDVLSAMFPTATEAIGISELNKERFAKGQLKGARTNVFEETNVEAATELIKSLSGGGKQSGDVKNARDRSKWRSFIQLIFDSNSMPRFNDSSFGFKRRFTRVKMPFTFKPVVDTDNKFEKLADPTIAERLVSEENMSGILNLIIARAPEIIPTRKICRREDDYEDYEEDANSFNLFVDEFIDFNELCRSDLDYRIASSDLYDYFSRFVEFGGSPMSQFSFSRKMGERNGQPSKTLEGKLGGAAYRGFKGLKFKVEKFNQYIATKSANILNSNTTNYSLTGCNGEETDRVTSITSYGRIIENLKKEVKGKEGYRGVSKSKVVGQTRCKMTPDSEKTTDNSTKKTDTSNKVCAGFSNGLEATRLEEPKKPRPKLITARITMDCDYNGKSYTVDQVVSDLPEVIRCLPAVVIKQKEVCHACRKAISIYSRTGRGDLCESCFKAMCPESGGAMSKVRQVHECSTCGKTIAKGALMGADGQCEPCYWRKLGISKQEATRLAGNDDY
jgi:phage/plasmid-associated DNA primase